MAKPAKVIKKCEVCTNHTTRRYLHHGEWWPLCKTHAAALGFDEEDGKSVRIEPESPSQSIHTASAGLPTLGKKRGRR